MGVKSSVRKKKMAAVQFTIRPRKPNKAHNKAQGKQIFRNICPCTITALCMLGLKALELFCTYFEYCQCFLALRITCKCTSFFLQKIGLQGATSCNSFTQTLCE